jgi:sec-independent protein translocase protein TatA
MLSDLMQPMHLLVLLVIAILFFGPSKLGEFGKGLGDGIRHFKNAMKEGSAKPEMSATAEKPAASAVTIEAAPAENPALPAPAENKVQ